ncbi:MAG: radical SAM protein [Pseudomonadota bacterium]
MAGILVNEVYLSIQGESSFVGWPCVIVRTTGCPLRCKWCDTQYAYDEGKEISVEDLVSQTMGFGVGHVEVTGGEPLVQREITTFMLRLCDLGKTLLLETNGAMDISKVDPRVHIIMDFKCPDSGELEKMRWENLDLLQSKDEVKFVLASRQDYEFARQVTLERKLNERCQVLISVVHDQIERQLIAEWILEDRLPARFQMQMHKVIWPRDKRGV